MKQLLLIVFLLPIVSMGQRERNKLNSEKIKLEEKKSFHSIVLDKNLEIDLFRATADSAIDFEVDPEQYKYIETKVKDSVLTISSTSTLKPRNSWSIKLFFKKLKSVKASNNGKINLHSNVKADKFEIYAENGGSVLFKDKTVVESKKIELIAHHRASIEGKLATDTLNVNLQYLSDIRLEFVRSLDKADIELKHDCAIDIRGNNTHITQMETRLIDHCDADLRVFQADSVKLDMFENSKIDISVNKNIRTEITGNSRVNIYGEPTYEFLELKQGSEIVNQNN